MATTPSLAPDGTSVPGAAAVVAWLDGLASPDLSDAERIDRLRVLEELKGRECAVQARLAVDLDESQRAVHAAAGVPVAQQGRGVASQLGLARRESPHRAGMLLGLGKVLLREMPYAFAALKGGKLTEFRVSLLARETACLSLEDRATVDRVLCAVRPGSRGGAIDGSPRRPASSPSASTRTRVPNGPAVPNPNGT